MRDREHQDAFCCCDFIIACQSLLMLSLFAVQAKKILLLQKGKSILLKLAKILQELHSSE